MLTYNYPSNPILTFALLNQSKRYIAFMDTRLTDLVAQKTRQEEDKLAKEDTLEENEQQPNEENKVAAVPAHAWTPTEQWLAENKAHLPLKQILGILAHVSSRLERAYLVYEATEAEMLKVLERVSIVGVQEDILKFSSLKFLLTADIDTWLSQYLWKTTFLRNYRHSAFVIERIRYVPIFPRSGAAAGVEPEAEKSIAISEIIKREEEDEKEVAPQAATAGKMEAENLAPEAPSSKKEEEKVAPQAPIMMKNEIPQALSSENEGETAVPEVPSQKTEAETAALGKTDEKAIPEVLSTKKEDEKVAPQSEVPAQAAPESFLPKNQ